MPKKFISKQEKRTYQSWSDMKSRCNNKHHARYHNYGGAGITVCSKWTESFEEFVRDMGLKPDGLALGRKDKRAGYNPDNCEWISLEQNNFDKRLITRLTYKGKTQSIDAWAQEAGIPRTMLSKRIHDYGWSVKAALTAPWNHVENVPSDPDKAKYLSKDRLEPV